MLGIRGVQVMWRRMGHILGLHQLVGLTGSLTLKQVAVLGSLLQHGGVDGIALFKHLLGGGVLADQTGDP